MARLQMTLSVALNALRRPAFLALNARTNTKDFGSRRRQRSRHLKSGSILPGNLLRPHHQFTCLHLVMNYTNIYLRWSSHRQVLQLLRHPLPQLPTSLLPTLAIKGRNPLPRTLNLRKPLLPRMRMWHHLMAGRLM